MVSTDSYCSLLSTRKTLRKRMFLDLLPIALNPLTCTEQENSRANVWRGRCNMKNRSMNGTDYKDCHQVNCPPKRHRISSPHLTKCDTVQAVQNEKINAPCGPEPLFIPGTEVASMLVRNAELTKSTSCGPIILDLRGLPAQTCVRIRGAVGIPCESRIKLRLVLPMLDDYLTSLPEEVCTHPNHPTHRLIILCTEYLCEETLRPNSLILELAKHIQSTHSKVVRLLKGGFRDFRRFFPHLCEQAIDHRLKAVEPGQGELRLSEDQLTEKTALTDDTIQPIQNTITSNRVVRNQSFLLPGLSLLVQRDVQKARTPSVTNEPSTQEDNFSISPKLNTLFHIFNSSVFSNKESESARCVFHTKISQILPFLYIGNEIDGVSEQVLQACNISFVLNVTTKAPFPDEARFQCCRIAAADSESQDLRSFFNTAFQFIEESRLSGSNILVHCQAGVSRSPSLVIAYLMAHSQLSLRDAYLLVKSKRSVISPNFSFLGQLFDFEAELNAGTSLRKPDVLSSILSTCMEPRSTEHKDDLVTMAFEPRTVSELV